jgi:hypothetical protein
MKCPNCKNTFSVPEDEQVGHGCPYCGYGPEQTCNIENGECTMDMPECEGCIMTTLSETEGETKWT